MSTQNQEIERLLRELEQALLGGKPPPEAQLVVGLGVQLVLQFNRAVDLLDNIDSRLLSIENYLENLARRG